MDVVVFSYNRADKLKMCLDSIDLAHTDTLWIFCDAARSAAHADAVARNRDVAMAFRWPNKRVVLRPVNFGTPKNVISGLDEVFTATDRCLILEDDCIVRPEAYGYLEWALERFKDDPSIFSVNTMAPLSGPLNRIASAFTRAEVVASPRVFAFWGWATWADRWREFRPSLEPFANPYGSARNTPWSYAPHIRWTLEQFEQGKAGGWDARLMVLAGHAGRLHLHPRTSMIRNIGLDGSGSHFKATRSRVEALSALQWSTDVPRWQAVREVRESMIVRALSRLDALTRHARSALGQVLPAPVVGTVKKYWGGNERRAQW